MEGAPKEQILSPDIREISDSTEPSGLESSYQISNSGGISSLRDLSINTGS